ncbi:spore coat associated protein CotJA [Alkaliphilus hydrothermalis]|uniref:Spore coat associated protein JA (CotJA) n=1 Tax=Alkaliphilus hydrothermalis TaxID=1482730 RepID=A0ABS2NND4_9FIRM|nr:spore coat associated protein CotJA [Alkaliphilus hydrothermalis]MBM7614459.1 hypothetical protein [Alkaliphilus hydrothermalis]
MNHQDPRQHHPKMMSPFGIYPIPFMPACPQYANAYVPYQYYCQSFPLPEALMKGTLFPELYKPYMPERQLGGE